MIRLDSITDTCELKIQGLPALTLRTQGQSPSGWVNPAAVGMVFGICLDGSRSSIEYIFP